MLIWLPPSEGKNAPSQGPSLDLNALSRASLATSRRTVCDALAALGDGPEAAAVLKVGARINLSVNTALDSAPCAPASQLFTGVLYEAIEECAPSAWSGAGAAHVSIFSGLFGVLSPSDVIPDHRLAMGVSLPDLGVLSTWWAPRLDEALSPEASERIIVDGRSGPYRAARSSHTMRSAGAAPSPACCWPLTAIWPKKPRQRRRPWRRPRTRCHSVTRKDTNTA